MPISVDNMIRCPTDEDLERYANEAGASSHLDAHVTSCGRCRAWLEEARADENLLGNLRGVLKAGASSADWKGFGTTHGAARLPERIGSYRIVGTLGEGGMGVVLEAEQDFPQRTVAIKLVRPGRRYDAHAIRLFEREVRALARLKHQAIAAIFDAGHTESGDPYLVMERVHGEDLARYVKRTSPSIPARLTLFRQICDGLIAAHQRGVIHRDLKPANILVESGAKPTVKILDFGLARIADPDSSEASLQTQAGSIRGTLAYMSPEQAAGRGDEIDVRSDVYSLGVVLYEMLTSELPYVIDRARLHDAVRTICESPPRSPSLVNSRIDTDLQTICLKALEKEPALRYQSVAALADDLDRHARNEPILARPPSRAYQIRKFVARHTLGVGFAVAMLTVLGGFGAWMNMLYRRADAERQEALTAKATADSKARTTSEVQQFLEEMLSSTNPTSAKGRDVSVLRELLDVAAARVRTDLNKEPEAAAAVERAIGNTYLSLGLFDLANEHLTVALTLRRHLFGESHASVAESLNDLGVLLRRRGVTVEAEKHLVAAMEMRRTLFGEESAEFAESTNNMATLRIEQRRWAEGEQLVRRAIDLQQRRFGEKDPELALGLQNLSTVLLYNGKLADAEAALRRAIAIRKEAYGDADPQLPQLLTGLAHVLIHMKGDKTAGELVLREAVAINKKLFGPNHSHSADTLAALGYCLANNEQDDEAASTFQEAIRLIGMTAHPDDLELMSCSTAAARSLVRLGRHADALPILESALARMQHHGNISDKSKQEAVELRFSIAEKLGDQASAEEWKRVLLDKPAPPSKQTAHESPREPLEKPE